MATNNVSDDNKDQAQMLNVPAPVPGLGMCTAGPRDSKVAFMVFNKIHGLVRLSSKTVGGVGASAPQV
jgi:hypothetical protein